MTDQKPGFEDHSSDKLSARMSVFAWIICATLGWALAFTSYETLIDSAESGATITAQSEPGAEEAASMEQIIPAAGNN